MGLFSRAPSDSFATQLVESLPFGAHVYRMGEDATFRLLYTNPSGARIGVRGRELEIGQTLEDALPPVIGTWVAETCSRVVREGEAHDLGHLAIGDASKSVHVQAIPLSPNVVGLLFDAHEATPSPIRDASGETTSEDAETRFRTLVEATASAVWTTSPAGELIGDQTSWTRLTDQSPDVYSEAGWLEAIHPEDRAATASAWAEAVETRGQYAVAHRLLRHDGEYRHMKAVGTPVLDASGEIKEWVGAHTDVHDQVMAAAVLEESDARLRTLFDALTDVVLVYPLGADGAGRFLAFNKAAVDTYGYTAEELRALTIADLIKTMGGAIDEALETLRRETRVTFESVHVTHLGERLHMSTSARLIEYEGELCVLAVCRDDTEARNFRREISRANLRLEREVGERTKELEAFAEDVQILHRITTAEHSSLQEKVVTYLEAGCEMFDLPLGILSSVRAGEGNGEAIYRIEATVSPDPSIRAGLEVPLEEAFCDAVIETEATVAYADALTDAPEHPACVHRGLRAFIGTPVYARGELYGTINFVSPEPRTGGFAQAECELIEMMAISIGRQIDLSESASEADRSLAWYRAISQAVNDAVVHVSLSGSVLEHNEAARPLLDASGEKLGPRLDIMGSQHGDEFAPEALAMKEGRPVRDRMQGIGERGARKWYMVNAAPVDEDSDGIADGAVIVYRDVTQLRELTEAAERSRDMLRSVLETSPQGVMAFRAVRDEREVIVDFEWLLVNQVGSRIVGRSEDELLGRRLLDEMPGNRDAGLFDAYVNVVDTGESWETIVPYAHEGLDSSFRLVAVPLAVEDGFTVTFVETVQPEAS